MVNYPPPKGKYEALLTIVKVLDEESPIAPEELADKSQVRSFGYGPEDGTTLSPKGSSQAYDELDDVLGVVTTDSNHNLRLTKPNEEADPFLPDASGKGLANLLSSDSKGRGSRATIAAFLLRKLNNYDMPLKDGAIENAFHAFNRVLWNQKDPDTGVYGTNWGPSNLIGSEALPGADWNTNKVKFIRDRAVDLGVAKRERTSSHADNLLPVLSTDVLQVALYHTYRHFDEVRGEDSPEFEGFYQEIHDKWFPLPEEFFERHVVFRGPLAENTEIDSSNYPILFNRLQDDLGEADYIKVSHLEGEKEWREVRASEFVFEAKNR